MKRLFTFCIVLVVLSAGFAYAHSGRTDSKGGHHVGGTSEYHYHHGYPAHDHPNGECRYDFKDISNSSSSSSSKSQSTNSNKPASPSPEASKTDSSKSKTSKSKVSRQRSYLAVSFLALMLSPAVKRISKAVTRHRK